MQLFNYLKPKMQFIGTLVMAFAMFSCGSYQYAGYENDSIYGDADRTVVYVEDEPTSDNSQYYKNYFKSQPQSIFKKLVDRIGNILTSNNFLS